jgi:1,4-dihydroxy-6-naphthoate synthase
MKLTLGFSPCPNDTFIFDALLHGKIDTEGLRFEPVIADVEELNRRAFAGELHITKLSYHAYAWLVQRYVLLDAGSALGNNCGPLLIAKELPDEERLRAGRVAIPGKYTTANFLLSLAYPDLPNKVEMLFSDIESAVLSGEVLAGLIIHENRFTYQARGLKKIMDLGEYWEQSTGLPIPLGGIVIRRDLSPEVWQRVNRVLERSVRFAFEHPEESKNFVKKFSQEMEEEVMYSHINLYVNDFTVNLGGTGRTAVGRLFDVARARGVIPSYEEEIFMH